MTKPAPGLDLFIYFSPCCSTLMLVRRVFSPYYRLHKNLEISGDFKIPFSRIGNVKEINETFLLLNKSWGKSPISIVSIYFLVMFSSEELCFL